MKILVTGGLGFVGINVVRFLADQPVTTVVAADLAAPDEIASSFLQPVADSLIFARLDVTDRHAVRALVERESITHIVHAAAITATDEQEAANPTRVVDVNLGGTINVLDAAIACAPVERLILISSSGVYAVPAVATGKPISEEGPLALDNLYAVTKYSAELLTARYSRLSGKPMTAVRLPAVYGPAEAPRESRTRTSTVHQLLVALRRGMPISVAGAHFSRDWIYAEDVGRAIGSLLRAEAWRYPVYNISSGQIIHFRELVEEFERRGLQAQWVDDPTLADVSMRPSQMRDPLDTTRLREETGFAPRIDLAAGIDAILAAPG